MKTPWKRWVSIIPRLLPLSVLLFAPIQARAADKPDARGIYIEEIKNEKPTFHVRVAVDRDDRTYKAGDEVKVTVQSNRDGFLYLFYLDAGNSSWRIFPNSVQKENAISAGKPISVPAPDSKFRFRVGKPFGKELLKAVVSTKPLALKGFDKDSLDKDAATLDIDDLRRFAKAVKDGSEEWAEHSVEITTVDSAAATPATPTPNPGVIPAAKPRERRVGLFVGVGRYDNLPKNKQLPPCVTDARAMASVFKEKCGLNEAIVLVDHEATVKSLEEALCRKLVNSTKPGDTVIVFWSGHGDYIDLGPKQREHILLLSETEVPSLPDKPTVQDLQKSELRILATSITSVRMQRWLQCLDGRRIVFIADACFSSGLHAAGKSIPNFEVDPQLAAEPFFGDMMRRSKSLDQREMAFLASSKSNETSLMREEGDFSVFSYFLMDRILRGADALSLEQLLLGMAKPMREYVAGMKVKKQKDQIQSPVLINQMSNRPPFVVRPTQGK